MKPVKKYAAVTNHLGLCISDRFLIILYVYRELLSHSLSIRRWSASQSIFHARLIFNIWQYSHHSQKYKNKLKKALLLITYTRVPSVPYCIYSLLHQRQSQVYKSRRAHKQSVNSTDLLNQGIEWEKGFGRAEGDDEYKSRINRCERACAYSG